MKTTFKKITNIFLVSLIVLLSASLAKAQPQGQQGGQHGPPPLPNDEQIEQMIADLSKELSMSEEQESQVSEVYFAHFEEVSEVVGDGKSMPDRDVMEQMKSDFETEVKSYLTKDQQKQFDKYQKKQQSNRGGQGAPPR